jgi:hypothetical protein
MALPLSFRGLGVVVQKHADAAARRGRKPGQALEWAAAAVSPHARSVRMRNLVHFARFQHAEDDRHELLLKHAFTVRCSRPLPYICQSSRKNLR